MSDVIAAAATVIVLRDGTAGPEAFMVRRHHAIAFMAGAHVFPGGRVDAADREGDASWCDGVPGAQQKLPGISADDALAFHVAAARELFEEAGVMLARNQRSEYVTTTSDADRDRLTQARADLNGHRRAFKDIVVGERLRLALDALTHFAHWVTPPVDVRRFDTRFFVARLPPAQTPAHDDGETTESVWITPSAALAASTRGDINLPPPTWATLRELERFKSVEAVLAWAAARRVYRREPKVTEQGGVRKIVLPGDASLPEPEPVAYETRFELADGRWKPEAAR